MKKIQIIKKLNFRIAILLFIFLFIAGPLVKAVPPLPIEFYGGAQLFNSPAPIGTEIKAYDSNGTLCGRFLVTSTGNYGSMTCSGKDTSGIGEGPLPGEEITFKLNTYVASAIHGDTSSDLGTVEYIPGTFKYLNIIAPPLICGDGFCDLYETCATCTEDCGSCPPAGGGGASGGGSGGSGGSGSGAGVSTSSPTTGTPAISVTGPAMNPTPEESDELCVTTWVCSEWSPCFPNGTTSRECVDTNNCNSTEDLPDIFQICIYEIENETIIFPEQKPPRFELPLTISTCTQRLGLFSFPSMLFIFLFLLLIIISAGRMQNKLRKLKKNKTISDIKKLEAQYHLKKETYVFITVITIMAIIVYIYHYFFFLCKDKYIQHLWLLALFVIISPIIIKLITEFLKYNEDVKLLKLKMLNDSHYLHFKKLVEITNNRLQDIEERISKYIYHLENLPEFHSLLLDTPEVHNIYKDMNKLYILYKEKNKNSFEIEKDLLENIHLLSNDVIFEEAADKHPELLDLKNDLNILYKIYESKQELYDELFRIEQDYELSLSQSNTSQKSNPQENENNAQSQEMSKEVSENSEPREVKL